MPPLPNKAPINVSSYIKKFLSENRVSSSRRPQIKPLSLQTIADLYHLAACKSAQCLFGETSLKRDTMVAHETISVLSRQISLSFLHVTETLLHLNLCFLIIVISVSNDRRTLSHLSFKKRAIPNKIIYDHYKKHRRNLEELKKNTIFATAFQFPCTLLAVKATASYGNAHAEDW